MKLVLAIALFLYPLHLLASELIFYGNATDVDTGEALYQEIHTLTLADGGEPAFETVEYVAANGELLGRKELIYKTASAPDYQVEFFHIERKETVINRNDRIDINAKKEVSLPVPSSLFAIDGGFHYFIQQNFSAIERGETVEFEFLSAGRGLFIPLEIAITDRNETSIVLSLKLQNFILARLVKPIELTYEIDTKRLLAYKGLTNVPGEDGKLITALITYDYSSLDGSDQTN